MNEAATVVVRTFETILWDDHATVAPFLSRVREIVQDAGYVVSSDDGPGEGTCAAE